MQTAGQLNPGLTFTAELSAHEGGRRDTSSEREGGVCLIMSGSVPFYPLEKWRKPEGTGEETDLRGDVRRACDWSFAKNNINGKNIK